MAPQPRHPALDASWTTPRQPSVRTPSDPSLQRLQRPDPFAAPDFGHDREHAPKTEMQSRRESRIGLRTFFSRSRSSQPLSPSPRLPIQAPMVPPRHNDSTPPSSASARSSALFTSSLSEAEYWSGSRDYVRSDFVSPTSAPSSGPSPSRPSRYTGGSFRSKPVVSTSPNASSSHGRPMVATEDSPSLSQAYAQAIRHIHLTATTQSADSLLRYADKLEPHQETESAFAAAGFGLAPTSSLLDLDAAKLLLRIKQPRIVPGFSAPSVIAAAAARLDWTTKIYVLTNSGCIIQYAPDGPPDRLPEKVLRLGPNSAAIASDAVPGRHWVLHVATTLYPDRSHVVAAESRSLFSRLSLRPSDRRPPPNLIHTSNLLMVFDSPDKLDAWIAVIRREIETLGGKKHVTETGAPRTSNHPDYAHDASGPPLTPSTLRSPPPRHHRPYDIDVPFVRPHTQPPDRNVNHLNPDRSAFRLSTVTTSSIASGSAPDVADPSHLPSTVGWNDDSHSSTRPLSHVWVENQREPPDQHTRQQRHDQRQHQHKQQHDQQHQHQHQNQQRHSLNPHHYSYSDYRSSSSSFSSSPSSAYSPHPQLSYRLPDQNDAKVDLDPATLTSTAMEHPYDSYTTEVIEAYPRSSTDMLHDSHSPDAPCDKNWNRLSSASSGQGTVASSTGTSPALSPIQRSDPAHPHIVHPSHSPCATPVTVLVDTQNTVRNEEGEMLPSGSVPPQFVHYSLSRQASVAPSHNATDQTDVGVNPGKATTSPATEFAHNPQPLPAMTPNFSVPSSLGRRYSLARVSPICDQAVSSLSFNSDVDTVPRHYVRRPPPTTNRTSRPLSAVIDQPWPVAETGRSKPKTSNIPISSTSSTLSTRSTLPQAPKTDIPDLPTRTSGLLPSASFTRKVSSMVDLKGEFEWRDRVPIRAIQFQSHLDPLPPPSMPLPQTPAPSKQALKKQSPPYPPSRRQTKRASMQVDALRSMTNLGAHAASLTIPEGDGLQHSLQQGRQQQMVVEGGDGPGPVVEAGTLAKRCSMPQLLGDGPPAVPPPTRSLPPIPQRMALRI